MGIPIGNTHTSKVEATFVRHFTCSQCGFESLAKVRSKGEGAGSSILWLREQGAKNEATGKAMKDAEEAADAIVALATCPSCDRRDENAASGEETSAWLGGLGLGALVAFVGALFLSSKSMGLPISLIAGAVVAILHVKDRAWRWAEVDERVTVLTHSEAERLLEKHQLDENEAA